MPSAVGGVYKYWGGVQILIVNQSQGFSGCDSTHHLNEPSLFQPSPPRPNKVGKEEAEVGIQAAEVKAVQADAQADLDVALPALEAALKALDSLTKNDITEVKGFAKPPPAVQIVMEAVCILLEVGDEKLMTEAQLLFAKIDMLPTAVLLSVLIG